LSSQKGGTFFTTKILKAASALYTETNEEYQKKQAGLVKEVVGIAGLSCSCQISISLGHAIDHDILAFSDLLSRAGKLG
jgi:hypothetical protein